MKELQIKADAGNVAWDMEKFQFFDEQDEFDTIHPSFHRISKFKNNHGLYEILPGKKGGPALAKKADPFKAVP